MTTIQSLSTLLAFGLVTLAMGGCSAPTEDDLSSSAAEAVTGSCVIQPYTLASAVCGAGNYCKIGTFNPAPGASQEGMCKPLAPVETAALAALKQTYPTLDVGAHLTTLVSTYMLRVAFRGPSSVLFVDMLPNGKVAKSPINVGGAAVPAIFDGPLASASDLQNPHKRYVNYRVPGLLEVQFYGTPNVAAVIAAAQAGGEATEAVSAVTPGLGGTAFTLRVSAGHEGRVKAILDSNVSNLNVERVKGMLVSEQSAYIKTSGQL